MNDPHPFADFIRILGRGPNLSRALSRDEARKAMTMILEGMVAPVQLGAFLMLLRYRSETPEELAGFIAAVRAKITPAPDQAPDLDWPSYADRHKQMPWFILASLALAQSGIKIAMHGISGDESSFLQTRPVLKAFRVPFAASAREAGTVLVSQNLVYLPLESLSPGLNDLFSLRELLGLRSAVNSLARALNPLRAPAQIQGVFHPNYRDLHLGAAALLDQQHAVIFKGGGGEGQRNPDKPCAVLTLEAGKTGEEDWPTLSPAPYGWREETPSLDNLVALWKGTREHGAAQRAITGTMALVLKMLGRAESQEAAQSLAEKLWAERLG